jgi:aminobenzoyl-glutamate transport protein
MLPFTVTFLIGWSVLLALWIALGLPVGPGAGLTLAG